MREPVFLKYRYVLVNEMSFMGRDASYEEALCERNRFGERRFV